MGGDRGDEGCKCQYVGEVLFCGWGVTTGVLYLADM